MAKVRRAMTMQRAQSQHRLARGTRLSASGGDSEPTAEEESASASEMDEVLGVHRASHRVALRQRAQGRFGGSFRGRDRPTSPPPLNGPIARLATVRPRSGDFAPIASEYETSLRGLYARADGCLGAQLLWDPDKGEATSLTMWASAQHLDALTKTDDYAKRMASLAQLLVGTPEVRSLQLLAHVNPAASHPTGDTKAVPAPTPGAQ